MTACVGCEVKDEAHDRALRADLEVGMTEQQVIALAGSPSRTVKVDFEGFCKDVGGVRVLLYDAVSVLFGNEMIDASVALCMDRNDKFILRYFIEL